jgi:hypothetical protein
MSARILSTSAKLVDHAVALRWIRRSGSPPLVRRVGVRILLAAVNAPKGDLDGNLATHLAVLDQARPRAATSPCSPSAR